MLVAVLVGHTCNFDVIVKTRLLQCRSCQADRPGKRQSNDRVRGNLTLLQTVVVVPVLMRMSLPIAAMFVRMREHRCNKTQPRSLSAASYLTLRFLWSRQSYEDSIETTPSWILARRAAARQEDVGTKLRPLSQQCTHLSRHLPRSGCQKY